MQCVATSTHTLRACTGAPIKQLNGFAVLESQPRPVVGAPAAYPDGWLSVSAETQASLGFRLTDALTHDAAAVEPIPHCLRLMHNSQHVGAWLVTYSLITSGLKAAPQWTNPAYSAIMLGIRGVQKGIEYARATAHNRSLTHG